TSNSFAINGAAFRSRDANALQRAFHVRLEHAGSLSHEITGLFCKLQANDFQSISVRRRALCRAILEKIAEYSRFSAREPEQGSRRHPSSELLLRYERREQDVLEAHEERGVGLGRQDDFAFVIHREPLEALAI